MSLLMMLYPPSTEAGRVQSAITNSVLDTTMGFMANVIVAVLYWEPLCMKFV